MINDSAPAPDSSATLELVDKALAVQAPLVTANLARIRRRRPDATPGQIIRRLNVEFRAATIGSGTAVGASAAAPGVGTGVALALSAGEAIGFMGVTALYVLSLAQVHGIPVQDIERRRTLLMAVMLGGAGAKSVEQVAERTGQHWARQVVKSIPMARINAVNKVLGKNFVTKYGTKQGIVVLGRVIPFGIGAAIGGVANAVLSQGVIKTAEKAFGPPPDGWHDQLA